MGKLEWMLQAIRNSGRSIRNLWRYHLQRHALNNLPNEKIRKIVIGSSGTGFKDWVSTDQNVLNLVEQKAWSHFLEPDCLDAILAEHVWEHLKPDEAIVAAKTCYKYLKPTGYLRVAVPDGFHPDPAYIKWVQPGGTGPGADDHKVLYTYASFCDLFTSVGFEVRLHEYFDELGQFHYNEWDPAGGMIVRSKRFDDRNSAGKLIYTSIVIDAIKPDMAG